MCVKFGNAFSTRYPITSGVPQAGSLSPFLLLAYTYDLPTKLKTQPAVKVRMFADDIKIYGFYVESSRCCVQQALSLCISMMMEWARNWELPVNLSKTLVLHIGKFKNVNYSIHNTPLRVSDETRDLGVYVNSNLKFDSHVKHIVHKAFAVLFTIIRNVRCDEASILIRLYKAYDIPISEYCSPVLNPQTRCVQRRIEKVQQTFTKF